MFVVRGADGKYTTVFQLDDGNLKEITYTSNRHVDHVSVTMEDTLYVIGGCYGRTVNRSNYNVFAPADVDIISVVESYDLKQGNY